MIAGALLVAALALLTELAARRSSPGPLTPGPRRLPFRRPRAVARPGHAGTDGHRRPALSRRSVTRSTTHPPRDCAQGTGGVAWALRDILPPDTRRGSRPARDTEGGRHAHAYPIHRSPRIARCWRPRPAATPAPPAPAASERQRRARPAATPARPSPATSSSSSRTTSSCRTPTTSSRRSTPRPRRSQPGAAAGAERGLGRAHHRGPGRAERRRRRRAAERRGRRGRVGRGERRHRRPGAGQRLPIVVGGRRLHRVHVLANVYANVLDRGRLRRRPCARWAAASCTCRRCRSGAEIQVFPEYLATVTEALNGDQRPNPDRSPAATCRRRSTRCSRWPSRPG